MTRLDVAMNDPLLMGMVHRRAQRDDQLQPIPDRHLVRIAVPVNGNSQDQLHDEVRAAPQTRAKHDARSLADSIASTAK
jgi:hypothetical protein